MLSSVLRSARAVAVNIAIMRAFVRLREMAGANAANLQNMSVGKFPPEAQAIIQGLKGQLLGRKLDELDRRVSGHDEAITGIVRAIRELAVPADAKPKRRIGFVTD